MRDRQEPDYVRFLLDTYELWGEDGCFTFPDGLTWRKDDPSTEIRPKTGPRAGEQVMPRINGKFFICPCGCNVFTRNGLIYTCNACETQYEGTTKGV